MSREIAENILEDFESAGNAEKQSRVINYLLNLAVLKRQEVVKEIFYLALIGRDAEGESEGMGG